MIRKRKAEQEIEAQLATFEAQLTLERTDDGYELPHALVEHETGSPESQHIAAD